MSVSRKNVNELAAAGWRVAESGPWPALLAALRSLIGRTARPGWSR